MTCALCGELPRRAFAARGASAEGFSVRLCPCGTGWTDPPLPDSELAVRYPLSYYGKENARFHPALEALVRVFRGRRAGLIDRLLGGRKGKILDVGCGRGLLLDHLRGMGHEPLGIETSGHAAWHARERLGLEVLLDGFEGARLREESFLSVVFWHALEHMPRPLDALKRAAALLEPGGLLVIAVPNLESWQARWTRGSWFHLDVPRHYVHFSLRSLRRALEGSGFRVARVDHFSLEQNLYGWLQSLLNALGLEFNLLYSALKTPSARASPLSPPPAQAAALALLLPLLLPLCAALMLAEAAFRRGGTVEVYAFKDALSRATGEGRGEGRS